MYPPERNRQQLGVRAHIVRAACREIIDTPTSASSASTASAWSGPNDGQVEQEAEHGADSMAATSPSQKFPTLANTE